MHKPYRLEIDGPRAIAVLLVVAFHLDIHPIVGGFVGVDVFYVISGFVIFRNILSDLESHSFSVRAFYQRRIRRIFPALAVVILFSLAIGFVILTPDGYMAMAYSALAALFSGSNIYFFDRSGYFATAAKNIPLLHTWSLGVEEQFYLLAPLAVLLIKRMSGDNRVMRLLVMVVLFSFAYYLMAIYILVKENDAFYLPMSRLWEIAIGGIIALLEKGRSASLVRPNSGKFHFSAALGLLGIAISAIFIDSSVSFQWFVTVLPVASTALIIWSVSNSGESGAIFRVLTVRPMVFFGRISYSLYLFHWPILVFAGLYVGRDLLAQEKAIVFVAAVLLSALSWKYVEQPFRSNRGIGTWPRARIALSALALCAIAACGLVVWTGGVASRLNPDAQKIVNLLKENGASEIPCTPVPRLNVYHKGTVCSQYPMPKNIDYIVWGDSHAGMYGSELAAHMYAEGKIGIAAGMPDCMPLLGVFTSKRKNREDCALLADGVLRIVRDEHVPVIILAGRWANLASPIRAPGDGGLPKKLYDREHSGADITFLAALSSTVQRFTAAGARVIIVGSTPEMAFDVPDMLIRAANLHLHLPDSKRTDFDLRQSIVLDTLRQVGNLPNVAVVYPHIYLCDEQRCSYSDGFTPLYVDDDHLSTAGAKRVVPAIIKAVMDVTWR